MEGIGQNSNREQFMTIMKRPTWKYVKTSEILTEKGFVTRSYNITQSGGLN